MAPKRPARRSNPVRPRPPASPSVKYADADNVDDPAAKQQIDSGSETSSESGASGSDNNSDEPSSGSKDSSIEEEVEVDIEFFDPKPEDFHGIKALLEGLLGGATYNVSSLADVIIEQTIVGTVIKSGEDEQPIGVASLLNVKRYEGLEAMQQLKAHLITSCPKTAAREQLKQALEDSGTGLLVNERVINCPPQIGPPLMEALFKEIEWATQDETTPEIRDSFKIKQYLVIAPAFVDPLSDEAAHDASVPPRKPPKKKAKVLVPAIVYAKPDDEYLHRNAKCSFTFAAPRVPGVEGDAADLQPLRLVMLVTAEAAVTARKELDEAIERVQPTGEQANGS